MRTGGAGGTCAQDPDRGRWNSCEKKKISRNVEKSSRMRTGVPACTCAQGPGPRKMEKLRKKKISRNVEKSSRMRTGGAGCTCAQGPDRGRWKSCEKKKFHEMSKNSRACALTVPGVRARRARTAEDGKVAKKKISRNVEKYSRMRTGGAGGTCAQGTDRGRWKSCEKKKFHEMSKNSRACALVVPGGRARRTRTAEDGKVAKKKNFSKCRKILAHAHWRCRGYVRVGHGPRKMEKLRKKKISRNVEKFSRMRTGGAGGTCAQDPDRGRWNSCEKKNFTKCRKILAHAHWRCRGDVRAGPGPRKMEKLRKKKISRNVEKFSRMRTGGAGGTCAQDPDRGRWNSCEKKNFTKCRKILAHAHWRCRGDVRAGPGPRKMEKLRKKKISRNVEKYSRMRTGGAGGTCA